MDKESEIENFVQRTKTLGVYAVGSSKWPMSKAKAYDVQMRVAIHAALMEASVIAEAEGFRQPASYSNAEYVAARKMATRVSTKLAAYADKVVKAGN